MRFLAFTGQFVQREYDPLGWRERPRRRRARVRNAGSIRPSIIELSGCPAVYNRKRGTMRILLCFSVLIGMALAAPVDVQQ